MATTKKKKSLEIFSVDKDHVVDAIVATGRSNYRFALANLVPLVNRLAIQRRVQNPRFYERLKRDILKRCIMPAITLAFVVEEHDHLNDVASLQQYVLDNIKDAFVLDGIQRLSTLERAYTDADVFHTVERSYVSKAFSIVERQIDQNAVISRTVDTEIEICCQTLSGLCINLRNRFFHFLATEPANISLNEIGDPDSLFECVNDHIFNWLAVLFFETLKHRVHAPI